MCSLLIHKCKSCGKDYDCNVDDNICSTINRDVNMNLCEKCEIQMWKDEMQRIDNERYQLYKDKI